MRRWTPVARLVAVLLTAIALVAVPLLAHRRLLGTGLLSCVDSPQAYFPLRCLVADSLAHGHLPWWNSYSLGGMPLAAQPDSLAFYPPTWLFAVVADPTVAFNIILMIHYGLAGLFTWLFLRRVGVQGSAALAGAFSFMFCGFLVGHRVHMEKVETAVWLPALFWALAAWRATRHARWLPMIAGVVALQILAGSMQFVLMTWLAALLLLAWWSATSGRVVRPWLFPLLAMGAGVACASLQVLLVQQAASMSPRAVLPWDQFSAMSFPVRLFWQLVFPFTAGVQWHTSTYAGVPTYSGPGNYAEMAAYAGCGMTVAACASFLNTRLRSTVLLFAILALGACVCMLGEHTPLWRLAYHVPLINKFRVPARYVVLLDFSIAVLAAIGIDAMVRATDARVKRSAALAVCGLVLAIVAWLVIAGHVPNASWSTAWVRTPLCAAGVLWLFCAASFIPRIGPIAAWCVVIPVAWDMLLYGYSSITTPATVPGGPRHPLAPVRAYHQLTAGGQIPPRVFNCFRTYWDKDIGIGANRNVIMRVPTLDVYVALFPKEFWWLGHYPSAFYSTVDALVDDNDVLSMLHARYLAKMGGDVGGRTRIRRVIQRHEPVPLPPLEQWTDTAGVRDRVFTAPSPTTPAIMTMPVQLATNTAYRLIVEASARNATDALRIDMYAAGYDNDAQEYAIKPFMLARDRQTFAHVIETGPTVPATVLLRVFTFSGKPVRVHEVRLERLEGPLVASPVGDDYAAIGDGLTENRRACPYAWVPGRLLPALGTWAALDWIHASPVAFDPRHDALMEGIAAETHNGTNVQITVSGVSPNARRFTVANHEQAPTLVVISEVNYPGWRATIDDQKAACLRINGLITGVMVPPGAHEVVLKYRPTRLAAGIGLCGAGVILVTCLTIIAARKKPLTAA